MKREPHQPDHPEDKLHVSISTVGACLGCASPTVELTHAERTSLTCRGELVPARKPKRGVVVIVRRCDAHMPVGGRVFPEGRLLNVYVNLPPAFFADALVMALSGQFTLLELTTEKLRRNIGAVLAARFVTHELTSHGTTAGFKGGDDVILKNLAAGGPRAGV